MRRRRRRALCGHRQPLEVCEGVEGRGEGRDNNIYEYTYMGEAGGTGGVTRCISLYLSFSLFFPSSLFFISLLLHLPFPSSLFFISLLLHLPCPSSLFFISLLLHHPFPSSLFFSRRVLASVFSSLPSPRTTDVGEGGEGWVVFQNPPEQDAREECEEHEEEGETDTDDPARRFDLSAWRRERGVWRSGRCVCAGSGCGVG